MVAGLSEGNGSTEPADTSADNDHLERHSGRLGFVDR